MVIAIFIIAMVVFCIYIWKVFLHYKLLRIENDGRYNKDEDYFLSLWIKNKNSELLAQGGSLKEIGNDLTISESQKLKEKINNLIQIVRYGIIVLLIGILIMQMI
ncbi:hypothetical protein WJR50_08040 [Catalinimonas sp. 4WD22]|uniref:hypothetical protein n=1 Tax=Catalinimonas locisalis TaxID=3133978 RepID=UPI0031017F2D